MDIPALILSCSAMLSPDVMGLIVDAESGGDPYLIQVGERRIVSVSAGEAVGRARALLAAGQTFRAGLLQVTNTGWAQYGLTVESVFDPCAAIKAGEQLVMEGYLLGKGVNFAVPATPSGALVSSPARFSPEPVAPDRAWQMPPALDGFAVPDSSVLTQQR